jgi:dihydroneopterin aldolase
MISTLFVQDYSLQCHLGCLAVEREHTQEVRASLLIESLNAPLACQSDLVEETICYAQLCKEMKRISTLRHFKTIENLCWEIYLGLQNYIPKGSKWNLSVHKVNPPIEDLDGGVHFRLGNFS